MDPSIALKGQTLVFKKVFFNNHLIFRVLGACIAFSTIVWLHNPIVLNIYCIPHAYHSSHNALHPQFKFRYTTLYTSLQPHTVAGLPTTAADALKTSQSHAEEMNVSRCLPALNRLVSCSNAFGYNYVPVKQHSKSSRRVGKCRAVLGTNRFYVFCNLTGFYVLNS